MFQSSLEGRAPQSRLIFGEHLGLCPVPAHSETPSRRVWFTDGAPSRLSPEARAPTRQVPHLPLQELQDLTLTTPPWNTWIHHSDFGTEPRVARGPNPAGPGPFLRPFCPKRPARTTLSPFPTPSPPRTVVQAPPRGYRDPTRRADTLGLTKPATGRATPKDHDAWLRPVDDGLRQESGGRREAASGLGRSNSGREGGAQKSSAGISGLGYRKQASPRPRGQPHDLRKGWDRTADGKRSLTVSLTKEMPWTTPW